MVSKKEVLILGVAVIGGLGIASMMSKEGDGFGNEGFIPGRQFFGGGGETPSVVGAPNVYNIPASPQVNFPSPPTFDFSSFLAPLSAPVGSAASKKSVSGGAGVTSSKRALSPLTGVIAGLKQTTGSVTPSKTVLSPLTGVTAGLSKKKSSSGSGSSSRQASIRATASAMKSSSYFSSKVG